MQNSWTSFDEAMKVLQKGRKNFRILSAWIDAFDDANHKSTVFHECYVNAVGRVDTV